MSCDFPVDSELILMRAKLRAEVANMDSKLVKRNTEDLQHRIDLNAVTNAQGDLSERLPEDQLVTLRQQMRMEAVQMGSQTGEPQREAKWAGYCSAMNNELETFSKEIEVLEQRLGFILTRSEPADGPLSTIAEKEEEAESNSSFFGELYKIKAKLSQCHRRVRDISERIDL